MFCTIEDISIVVVQRVFPVGTGPLSTFSLRGSFSLINTPLKTTGIDGVNSRTQAGFPAPKKRPGPVQQEKNLMFFFGATCWSRYLWWNRGLLYEFQVFLKKPFWKLSKKTEAEKTWIFQEDSWNWKNHPRWWFQICFIFIPIWGNDPIWLIFFKWVETTN